MAPEEIEAKLAEREILYHSQRQQTMGDLEALERLEAGNLSGGQKKLLELGRAMMTDSKLVLLDEPGAVADGALARRDVPDPEPPMIAVVSDLHSNIEALDACRQKMIRLGVTQRIVDSPVPA